MNRTVTSVFVLLACFIARATAIHAQDYSGPYEVAHTHTTEDFPGKALHFAVDDSLVIYQPSKGKPLEMRLPEGPGNFDGIDAMRTLLHTYPKAFKKFKADDVLFLTHALITWESIRMTIGFTFTESGLGYKITEKGTGKLPEAGKRVYVHYKGYLEDGTEFDNSFKRGEPIAFELGTGRVIKGWDEGIQLFPVGSKGTLRIPAELGYGARGAGGLIPPNATLMFDIEVVKAD